MSTTSLNFHNVVEASARVQHSNGIKWMSLDFRDSAGAYLDIALFSDSPEKLLEAIAAVSRPAAPDLLAALQAVIASWDSRSFEQERHSTHPELPGGYWTPSASMVDSEVIANARAAVSRALDDAQTGNGQPNGGA